MLARVSDSYSAHGLPFLNHRHRTISGYLQAQCMRGSLQHLVLMRYGAVVDMYMYMYMLCLHVCMSCGMYVCMSTCTPVCCTCFGTDKVYNTE